MILAERGYRKIYNTNNTIILMLTAFWLICNSAVTQKKAIFKISVEKTRNFRYYHIYINL